MVIDASVEPIGGGVEIVDSGTLLIDVNRILREHVSKGLEEAVINGAGAEKVLSEVMRIACAPLDMHCFSGRGLRDDLVMVVFH